MTDKKLAKRMTELCDAFKKMCQARACEGCEMVAYAKEGVCAHAWVWKRLRAETCGTLDVCPAAQKEKAAAAAPNEPPEAKEEAKHPKWCKVGQWVISKAELKLHQSVEACFLKQIDEVDLDGHILFKTRTGERVSDCWERFIPVRFRPYTYCEAEGLLGKTMKCERDGKHSTHIVTFVQESSWHVEINGYPFTLLAEKFSATIDGLPIGVPEVDTKAMKEVE